MPHQRIATVANAILRRLHEVRERFAESGAECASYEAILTDADLCAAGDGMTPKELHGWIPAAVAYASERLPGISWEAEHEGSFRTPRAYFFRVPGSSFGREGPEPLGAAVARTNAAVDAAASLTPPGKVAPLVHAGETLWKSMRSMLRAAEKRERNAAGMLDAREMEHAVEVARLAEQGTRLTAANAAALARAFLKLSGHRIEED
jgi:hypothetical protein